MINIQISEADQNYINSLSKSVTVTHYSLPRCVYTLQINDCQLQLEFNPNNDQAVRWSGLLYSVFGNTLFETGSKLRPIVRTLIQREMKMTSRILEIDLVNHYDSLKEISAITNE